MPLTALSITDTRAFFRPVSLELVTLLRGLPREDWNRPTVAGSWLVRDVVAHLVDTSLRRLSFHRDRHQPPSPDRPPASDREFVAFINDLNRQWVVVARRLSPRVLTDLYASSSVDLATFMETLPLDAPALFPVSWAGEHASAGWFDIGREFTEQWHHHMQIRDAVGAGPMADAAWLRAFLSIAIRGLPHAYRATTASNGATVGVEITGAAGGIWTLVHGPEGWTLWAGASEHPTTSVVLTDDAAWRLLFNALPRQDAAKMVHAEGDLSLAAPLLDARSVIV
jgi:uncharacterized protein (TIGR03083 family)